MAQVTYKLSNQTGLFTKFSYCQFRLYMNTVLLRLHQCSTRFLFSKRNIYIKLFTMERRQLLSDSAT